MALVPAKHNIMPHHWQRAVMSSPLHPYTRLVLLVLSTHIRRTKEGVIYGRLMVSMEMLSAQTGYSVRSVRRFMKDAIDKGYVKKERVRLDDSGNVVWEYIPCLPEGGRAAEQELAAPDEPELPTSEDEQMKPNGAYFKDSHGKRRLYDWDLAKTYQHNKTHGQATPEQLEYLVEYNKETAKRAGVSTEEKERPAPEVVPELRQELDDPDALHTWKSIKEQLRFRHGEASYNSWIKPIRLQKTERDHVTLAVPTALAQQHLEKYYMAMIVEEWRMDGKERVDLVVGKVLTEQPAVI